MGRGGKKRRLQRSTLLVVGEGATEVAFVKYLKQLYCRKRKGVKVTLRNAHGKGPGNVVDTAIGQSRPAAYDRVAALLDTDIPWGRDEARAQNHGILLLGNTPCIEGTFLRLLGEAPAEDSSACKGRLRKVLKADLLDAGSYESWCSRKVLEAGSDELPDLQRLISLLQGEE